MADAEVLHMPETWVQNCFACTHALFGERGTYCPIFQEQILSEKLAGQDCPEFVSNDGRAFIRLES